MKTKNLPRIHIFFSVILCLAAILELLYIFTLKPFYFSPLEFEPAESVTEFELDKKIATMSLKEKVGAILMVGFSGTSLSDENQDFIQTHHLRHFLLLGRNISNEEQLSQLTSSLTEATASSVPSLISVDQEGGQVERIRFEGIDHTAQAEIQSVAQAFKVAKDRGEALKNLGINLNFAPVVEVIRDEGSYLGYLNRAFLGDEEQVFLLSKAMIQGYKEAGLVTLAKHFPAGLGRQSVDPHQALPVLDISYLGLYQDLKPLARLIKQGRVQMIMSTHILYPQIDENEPVTTSEKLISAILRQDLGFRGVIVTDDLVMRGISSNQTVEEAAVKAFQAGHDLLLVSGPQAVQERVYQALIEAVKSGEITEIRLNASLKRILSL